MKDEDRQLGWVDTDKAIWFGEQNPSSGTVDNSSASDVKEEFDDKEVEISGLPLDMDLD